MVGRAEIALAEGDVDQGLALYRRGMASDTAQALGRLDVEADLTPWAVYGVAATLFVGSLHGRRHEVSNLDGRVRDLLRRTTQQVRGITLDYPIMGNGLAALGAYRITDASARRGGPRPKPCAASPWRGASATSGCCPR